MLVVLQGSWLRRENMFIFWMSVMLYDMRWLWISKVWFACLDMLVSSILNISIHHSSSGPIHMYHKTFRQTSQCQWQVVQQCCFVLNLCSTCWNGCVEIKMAFGYYINQMPHAITSPRLGPHISRLPGKTCQMIALFAHAMLTKSCECRRTNHFASINLVLVV